jgi:hypothetical protein
MERHMGVTLSDDYKTEVIREVLKEGEYPKWFELFKEAYDDDDRPESDDDEDQARSDGNAAKGDPKIAPKDSSIEEECAAKEQQTPEELQTISSRQPRSSKTRKNVG